jgi:hypothetical protein
MHGVHMSAQVRRGAEGLSAAFVGADEGENAGKQLSEAFTTIIATGFHFFYNGTRDMDEASGLITFFCDGRAVVLREIGGFE